MVTERAKLRDPAAPRALRIVVVVLILLLVELFVGIGWISPLFVSRPSAVAKTFIEMVAGRELWQITGITLFTVLVTFLSGTFLGLPMGYLLWRYPFLGSACENLLGSIFSSPLILLYPVFLVIFGRTLMAVIAQAFLVGIIPIILNTQSGLRQVSQTFIDVGLTLHLTRWQLFRYVLLPAAAPTIFTGLRMGFIYMLLSIIAMEFVVALGGVGNLVSGAYFRLDTEELYVGVTLVIFFSVLFFRLLLHGQKLVGPV
ncbi:MAG: ABC transporter permease subunit [Deltaproteobacteria bacterium]|nr:ABC transporter permease subunit [Deltaproteobacteria bacterium]